MTGSASHPGSADLLAADLEAAARYRELIDDWDAFAEALGRPLPPVLWTNPLRSTPEQVRDLLAIDDLGVEPLGWLPGAFRVTAGGSPGERLGHLAGLYHIQEEASLVPVPLLGVGPGERVLDLCAAPGGKTAQIAIALGNRGTVVANDRDWRRVTAMGRNLHRLGLVNVCLGAEDATGLPEHGDAYDRVLADVPCSCEGTVRKSPGVLARAARSDPERAAGAQRAILEKAVRLCRPGGRIVYSTCTFAPEENEAVVDAVLRAADGAVRLLPAALPGLVTRPGVTAWRGWRFDPSLARALRLWPHHNDTGGFFVVVLEKSPTAPEHGSLEGLDLDAGIPLRGTGRAADPGTAGAVARPVEDADALWGPLIDGLGLPADVADGLRLLHCGRRRVVAVAADLAAPERPLLESLGLPLLAPDSSPPRLVSEGVLMLGAAATERVVELGWDQARAYLRRRPVSPPASLGTDASAFGHRPPSQGGRVIVRHRGVALGSGVVDAAADPGDSVALRSTFPKRWVPGTG